MSRGRSFELREKSQNGKNTLFASDDIEDIAEFIQQKTGDGEELDPRVEGFDGI